MTFADRYYRYLLSHDLDGAWDFLGSLEGDELRRAKAWFQRRQTDQLLKASLERRSNGRMSDELRTQVSPAWVFSLGPIHLLAPKTAARKVLWRDFWEHQETGAAFLTQRLCEADRDWAAVFVEEASGFRAGDKGWTLAAVLRAVAAHHRLPCPTGETFLEHWSAGVPEMDWRRPEGARDPVGWLAADPFMPDLLFRYLASGHCGRSDWLPEVLPELVDRGTVDRDAIVQHVLVQLTAPQRPVSQKVLVGILKSLRLSADEVPGGCAYFLGVIATSTGLVGKQLLPLAIGAVTGPEDLAELAATIAGRPEKAQKTTLLAALTRADLRERVGVEPVRHALLLLAGGDDAAFVKKVKAALALLPGGTAEHEDPAAVEERAASWTLWEQTPTPSSTAYVDSPRDPRRDPTWARVVDITANATEDQRSRLVDEVLLAMKAGTFEPATELVQLRAILSGARLSMSATLTVLRDVFLSGGLRQGYQFALDLAEAVTGSSAHQPGTADLVRLLAEFAAEIPPPARPGLPRHLAALAEGAGASKAQEEARALRDRLAERPNRGATPAAPVGPPRRELWDRPAEPALADHPLPRLDRRLVGQLFGPSVPWRAVSDLTGGVANPTTEVHDGARPGVFFCGPDLLLSAVVSTVTAMGIDKARASLRAIEPAGFYGFWGGYLLALRTWANGEVDPARFWQLALSARTASSLIQELDGGHLRLHPALRTVLMPQLTSWDAVALDGTAPDGESYGLVLARSLDSAAGRLEFLRGLEVLLLADRNRTVLATPTWADGTLDLDHLLHRLRATDGKPIGPLDLVQALHRLRPSDPARVRDLDELAASGGVWRTAPALTSPHGDESWEVLDLVRTWVAEGGLPPLDPTRGADGLWKTQAVSPVPWSRCAAAPAELREDRWSLSQHADPVNMGRIFPLWPDRTLPAAGSGIQANHASFPALLSGTFERPLHETLLSLLVGGIERREASALAVARLALRCNKVSASTYTSAVVSRFKADQLKLETLARATEAMFEQDCLAQFWEPSLTSAAALCDLPGTQGKGLARFLEVLTTYVHEVPTSVVPPALRAFASSAGNTKPYHLARALVQALEACGQGEAAS